MQFQVNNSAAKYGPTIYAENDGVTGYSYLIFGAYANNVYAERMRIDSAGNVGIGTTNPSAILQVNNSSDTLATSTRIFVVSTGTTPANAFSVRANGDIYYVGTAHTGSADYAEYFSTKDTDLAPGEAVCVDVSKANSVKRCVNAEDIDIMGIISTNPSIVGNAKPAYENNSNYKIVAMLGQIPAKASAENGAIRPGDQLTAASIPGHIMKANAGDSTVGVALEGLDSGTGLINVLISRRNKSLTVEQIEENVAKRIADMKLEDEVNIMLADAIKSYDFGAEFNRFLDPINILIDAKLNPAVDGLALRINNLEELAKQQQDQIGILSAAAQRFDSRVGALEISASSTLALITEADGNNSSTLAGLWERLTGLENKLADANALIMNLQSVTSTVAAADSFESISVSNDSQFGGSIRVSGEAEFAGKVTVKGQVAYGVDTVGQAKILSQDSPAATTTVKIAFEQAYENLPICE